MPEEGNLLRDIIIYLGKRTKLQSTRVQKLMYLIEAEYADRYGKRIMDYDFYHDRFGMNSLELHNRVQALKDKNIRIEKYKTDIGEGFRVFIKPDTPDPHLPLEIKEVCDLILRTYGQIKNVVVLANIAKRTLPFQGTPEGKKIDWSLLTDPCARGECNCQLSEEGRRRLYEALNH
ncbi:MAG: DUF4065 domain-containing protein [Thermoplasmata archaeon]